jgi:hypothetical protein
MYYSPDYGHVLDLYTYGNAVREVCGCTRCVKLFEVAYNLTEAVLASVYFM